jgi:hypothetical protein
MSKRSVLLWLLFLSACGAPPEALPPPTPEAVFVRYPPALRPWIAAIRDCAAENPAVALYVDESLEPAPDPKAADLTLWLGSSPDPGFAAQIGWEEIAVIVHPDNPLKSLSLDAARALFSGSSGNWAAAGGDDASVQVWVYPVGAQLNQTLAAALLASETFSSFSMLAPDPAAMRAAVASDPTAIGFLPRAWVDESVAAVSLNQKLAESLRQPVIVLSDAEPQGEARGLLLCLQAQKLP